MLPIFTSVEDVRGLLAYLKNKPTGATTAEARSVLGTNPIDPRKMTAYAGWRFIERAGDRLKMTDRGWRFVRRPAEEIAIWREVIDSIVPYRSALEWAFHQGPSEISNVDVAAHWHEHHSEQVGTENENTLKDAAVCFFNVCQGAELGKLVIGRRGQATRLQINAGELKSFIEAGPTALPNSEDASTVAITNDKAVEPQATTETGNDAAANDANPKGPVKIFIAHGKNMTLVEQVQTMLSLGGFVSEVAEDEESTAIPVPEKVFSAMRRCQAGIIIVSADEQGRAKTESIRLTKMSLLKSGRRLSCTTEKSFSFGTSASLFPLTFRASIAVNLRATNSVGALV